ncbi:MAG: OsmC family protein [Actinomycetota bacterium]
MAVTAKVMEFAGGIDADGRLVAEDGAEPIEAGDGWTPEHLVLAAVTRCSLSSLRYYATRAKVEMSGTGRAYGRVTARPEDGRYAFVDVSVSLDVTLDPEPTPEVVAKLLRRAEDGCFIGQSLRAKPAYTWVVNGQETATG